MNTNSPLRREKYKQHSGLVRLGQIEHLKERHYVVLPVTPDGDAPKQYIQAYFYYKDCPRKSNPKTWDGYYAKFGSKSYPHESVIEYTINKIGEALGLIMNETRLVIANGQIRFLSKDFIKKGKRLIHGTEILAEYFEDRQFIDEINENKRERRELLTFSVVEEAIKYVHHDDAAEIINSLIQLIAFDAIVGNNDRHFYNWGVIGSIRKEDEGPVRFSPIYDSARGLLWNLDEKAVMKLYERSSSDSSAIEAYCNRSKPRFSFDENSDANHFELLKYLTGLSPNYRNIIVALVTTEKEQLSLQKLNETVSTLISSERLTMMERILSVRFKKIREIL
ncbi:HipA domain-containing protein [Marinoscillum sp.]|uniref:HipA domain-containing protein n=1 Tax=Marinoscillum sp. TaxID=2024838 RepID=UPI003BA9D414